MKYSFCFIALLFILLPICAQEKTGKKSWRKTKHEVKTFYSLTYAKANKGYMNGSLDQMYGHGIGVGYEYSFQLFKKQPVRLQTGLDLSFSTTPNYVFYERSDNYYTWYHEQSKARVSLLACKVPVSLSYAINLRKPEITIEPFIGIEGTFNIWGCGHITTTNNYTTTHQRVALLKSNTWHAYTCNLFNVGVLAGIKVSRKRFSVSMSFTKDFIYLYHEENVKGVFSVKTVCGELGFGYKL